MAEGAKIKIRLVRQDGLKELKKIKTGISADETKGLEKKVFFIVKFLFYNPLLFIIEIVVNFKKTLKNFI